MLKTQGKIIKKKKKKKLFLQSKIIPEKNKKEKNQTKHKLKYHNIMLFISLIILDCYEMFL